MKDERGQLAWPTYLTYRSFKKSSRWLPIWLERLATRVGRRAIPVGQEPETLPKGGRRPAQIGWQIASLTDVGLQRRRNEDSLLMVEAAMTDARPCGLYAVADGVGGREGGELASQLTMEAIEAQFARQPPTSIASFTDWLSAAAIAANQAVLAHQGDRTPQTKMGSTLIMALVTEGQAHIANVGDSRAYHLSRLGIRQLSLDHSLVERLVQIGQLTREQARTHRLRNIIYSTIGDKPTMKMDFYHVSLQPGERLLLCSDGLNEMLTDEAILDLSRRYANPAEACRAMIEAAKLAGGADNITVIAVQMEGSMLSY